MYWLAGALLGGILAAAVFVATKALVGLARRQWRSLWSLLISAGLFLLYSLAAGVAAYLLASNGVDGTNLEPTEKARLLAEFISVLMNASALGAPIGLLLAVVSLVRQARC